MSFHEIIASINVNIIVIANQMNESPKEKENLNSSLYKYSILIQHCSLVLIAFK